MAAIVKTRAYNSATRRLQLSATKAAILAAARDLMAERGYSATTIEQIADAAGVAVQTVYKHFGSKPAIVTAFIEQARQDPRLAEQRKRLLATTDARQRVRLIAQRARLHAEVGLHTAIAMSARVQDPELAKGLRRIAADVRRSHLEYARSLEQNGTLRHGVSIEEAADYIGLLGAPDLLLTMRRDKDWSLDQCEEWLTAALSRLLLD